MNTPAEGAVAHLHKTELPLPSGENIDLINYSAQ